jgi:hypothetical protein
VISNIWGPRKADSSVSNLDGSYSESVATNLTLNSSNSNEEEVKESKLPLNSLDNIARPLTCPGCQMDFKSFSGFVLHIENRSCMSSMCHEIEGQLDACLTQIFNTFVSSGKAWTWILLAWVRDILSKVTIPIIIDYSDTVNGGLLLGSRSPFTMPLICFLALIYQRIPLPSAQHHLHLKNFSFNIDHLALPFYFKTIFSFLRCYIMTWIVYVVGFRSYARFLLLVIKT